MAKIINKWNKNIFQHTFYKINSLNTYSYRSKTNSSIKMSK
jgi:hypothetical protein